MERNKKIIIGAGVALGVIALGAGAYFAWRNRAVVVNIISNVGNEGAIQPLQPTPERLREISSREVAGYWTVATTSTSTPLVLYADPEGNILRIDDAGDELVYAQSIANVAAVLPSANGSRALVEAKGVRGDSFHLFDATEGLPGVTMRGVSGVTWAPEGNDAAYFISAGGVTRLRTQASDLIGQSDSVAFSEITRVPQNDFTLSWPQKDALYMTQRPSAEYVSDMWRVDVKTKSIKKFLSDRGLMVRWAPFGTRALKFTTTEARAHKLALIDDKGAEQATVNFITLPDKCVMTGPTQMYCAIPRDQGALAKMTLPDDYLKRKVYFKDGIYQIDITNNGIRAIYEEDAPDIDAIDLTVLNDKILFINRYDRKLYSLKLQ